MVAKLNVAATRLNDLLSDNNRRRLSDILANLDRDHLGHRQTLRRYRRHHCTTPTQATANLRDASPDLKPTLDHVDVTVNKFGKVADDADAFINGDGLAQLSDLISEMRRLVASLTKFSDQLNRDPTKLLFGDRRKGYEPNDQAPASTAAPGRRLFLIGASSLALAACGSLLGPPPPRRSMCCARPRRPPSRETKVTWALAIVKPDASEALDTERIALARSDTQLDYYANAVWPDRLPDLVQTALLAGFEASGRIDSVARDEDALHADYELSTDMRDFEARYATPDGAPTVAVTIIAHMANAHSRKIVANLTVNLTQPASRQQCGCRGPSLRRGVGPGDRRRS